LATAEQVPLAGKRIVVTRAAEQAGELIRELERAGAVVFALPAVVFADPPEPAPLDQAIRALASFHWILFTSQNAVQFFVKRCRALGQMQQTDGGASAMTQPLVAAVGPATAETAKKEGLRVEYVARQFRGRALAEELGARVAGKRVLLPRSDRARADLLGALQAKGAEVVDVVAYQTGVPDSFDPGASEAICCGSVDVVSFLSPSAFHNLTEEIGLETLRQITGRVVLAAIGPVTAGAIRDAGLPVEIEAPQSTASSLVGAIKQYFAQRLPSGVNLP
jgi:uroporphyrinogen-III synthase